MIQTSQTPSELSILDDVPLAEPVAIVKKKTTVIQVRPTDKSHRVFGSDIIRDLLTDPTPEDKDALEICKAATARAREVQAARDSFLLRVLRIVGRVVRQTADATCDPYTNWHLKPECSYDVEQVLNRALKLEYQNSPDGEVVDIDRLIAIVDDMDKNVAH